MEDKNVEPKFEFVPDGFPDLESKTPWRDRFWTSPSGHDPVFGNSRGGLTRTMRRPVPTHRTVRHPRRNPRAWSYTNTVCFDEETIRLLVSWAVRWIRGNGLPLGYRDPYSASLSEKPKEY